MVRKIPGNSLVGCKAATLISYSVPAVNICMSNGCGTENVRAVRRREYDLWELFGLYNNPTPRCSSSRPEFSCSYFTERASDVFLEITMFFGGGGG